MDFPVEHSVSRILQDLDLLLWPEKGQCVGVLCCGQGRPCGKQGEGKVRT